MKQTRLLPVFGLFSEANSCRIPGSHSRATFNNGPRAAQAKVSRHAHVGSMFESFPCPFGREAGGLGIRVSPASSSKSGRVFSQL